MDTPFVRSYLTKQKLIMKLKQTSIAAAAIAGIFSMTSASLASGSAHLDKDTVRAEKDNCKGKDGCKGKDKDKDKCSGKDGCKGKDKDKDKDKCKGKDGCKGKEKAELFFNAVL